MFNKYDEVLGVACEIADAASSELDVRISLDEAIFKEAFIAAEVTCGFHGNGEPNHIKKVSHLCFWLVKLKPFSLSPRFKESIAEKTGIDQIVDQFEADYADRVKQAMKKPINEMVALALTNDLIEKGYQDIELKLDRIKRPEQEKSDRVLMRERLEAGIEKVNRSFGDIMISFREHNYSARGLAIMLCLVYSTGFESMHA